LREKEDIKYITDKPMSIDSSGEDIGSFLVIPKQGQVYEWRKEKRC